MAKNERLSEAIWLEKSSRWSCKVTKDGVRKAFYCSTPGRKGKREAERKADKWLESGVVHGGTKFGALWADFLQHEREVRGEKNTTYLHNAQYGRLYILPQLEFKKLDDIRPIDWQNCIDVPFANSVKAGKPLSAKSLKNIRGTLTALRSYCELCDIDLRSMRTLRIPDAAPVGERKILQPRDIELLFSPPVSGHVPHYLHAWRFQVLTGLRPGELYGLRNEDITPDGMCTISRSVNVRGDLTDGKNRNARRTFLLPSMARQVLQDQREHLRNIGVISPYIFPNTKGEVVWERAAYNMWKAFCASQGITPCSLYELRHTMISLSADVPDALLKPMVGHGKNMDTRGIYGHEVQGNRERTAALLDSAIRDVLNPF